MRYIGVRVRVDKKLKETANYFRQLFMSLITLGLADFMKKGKKLANLAIPISKLQTTKSLKLKL